MVLGTVCTVNAFSDGTAVLYDELFMRLHDIENKFSVNVSESEISAVNAAAGKHAVKVTPDVLYVIKTALEYAQLTDGAFDPTVGPLVKLWGINTENAHVPSPQEIKNMLPLVNWRNVKISGEEVFLTQKNMALDLGGIAKGYAADELAAILKKNNVKRAVIDLGGNIYVYGQKKDKSLWKVGIKNPADPEGDPAVVLNIAEGTVVKSGVYERFFIKDGKRYHHILDTKTGYPADNGLLSVTIISESSIQADALSTSVFVLGYEKGMRLINSMKNTGVLFITAPGGIFSNGYLEGKYQKYSETN